MKLSHLPVKMTAKRAEQIIRTIAETPSNIIFGEHAIKRMEERAISIADVHNVLTKGYVEGIVEKGKKQGEWKCKLVRHSRGNRDIGVVTIIIKEQRLFIKTVEWEDL